MCEMGCVTAVSLVNTGVAKCLQYECKNECLQEIPLNSPGKHCLDS